MYQAGDQNGDQEEHRASCSGAGTVVGQMETQDPNLAISGRWREAKCIVGSGEGTESSGRDSEKLLGKGLSRMDSGDEEG